MRYKSKRTYTWSNNVAYCVGLLASDGCLSKNGRHIDLTSVDYDQLENFRNALGRFLPISSKSNASDRPAYRIQFSDVALYDFLLKVGLTPNKSLTIPELLIPQQYYPDFLRGYFDGDGCTYGYMDKRWRSSFMYYVCFVSASLEFIVYLRDSNELYAGLSGGTLRFGRRAYNLSYAKADSLKLFHYMYYSPHIPKLHRKFEKLRRFVLEDQNAIIL